MWITLNETRLEALVSDLAFEAAASATATADGLAPMQERRDREAAAMLVLAGDAVNFGSGYHDVVRKRPGLSGARTMAAALGDYVDQTGSLTAARLQRVTMQDCAQIFGQELDGGALQELMERFGQALRDLGTFLADRFSRSALNLIDSAEGSAVTLAESLCDMPFYQDAVQHRGRPVAFYKRAQITPADLHRANLADFNDLDKLTAFADNLVPHVLRVSGVLDYHLDLADRIDRGVGLDPNCEEEVEIRAAGVHTVERIGQKLGMRAMDVDLLLWEMGARPEFKAVRRHRTRSVFY